MKAMVLEKTGEPLVERELPDPSPRPDQILVKVEACGVCRTDLHVVDGELPDPRLPIIPGHEIIGTVHAMGDAVTGFEIGQRVGVPWLGAACGHCFYCRREQENLCDDPGFTGYQINGGYAELAVANADFCFPVDDSQDAAEAAPLMCAGLIGYRSLEKAGPDIGRLGLYGFGAAAHIVAQIAAYRDIRFFAFTSPGDEPAQAFARSLGAEWAGGSDEPAPVELDAAIIYAPVGALVPQALRSVRKGGTVVCAGIHMSDIPGFPYETLWGERRVLSVANLTRKDGREFLKLAPKIPVRTTVSRYDLAMANDALNDLREGRLTGAAVLIP